jgi:hypothetical protein
MEKVIDYKKQCKELYAPKTDPSVIEVPEIPYIGIEGKGNPNEEDGEYKTAVGILYGLQYTIKMSKKGTHIPEGYFDYVVPPLEGFWWFKDGAKEFTGDKTDFEWLSVIRLPEYVNDEVFKWACDEAGRKKKVDTGKARLLKINEGLCVQCMHIGSFDDEPATIAKMHRYIDENGMTLDITDIRHHHELYLSDPRNGDVAKMKTIIRLPVRMK